MFTGIIEEIGTIERIKLGAASAELTVRAKKVNEGTKIGDSIAVNGICLTVIELMQGGFTADVMHETLNRSALTELSRGSRVNLERAMRADGRFGGHIVAGHVDGVGEITEVRGDDTAVWYKFKTTPDILRYIVEKGSVAIDGISLTVAAVTDSDFSISAIPHTVRNTVLNEKKAGDRVNIENDVIGKYVEKLLRPENVSGSERAEPGRNGITKEFLIENGF